MTKGKLRKVAKEASRKRYSIEDGVTQSMLQQFVTCRVACKYMLDGWRSPTPKRATQFGSLVHALLENLYAGSIAQSGKAEPLQIFGQVARSWEIKAAKAGDKVEEIQADLAKAKAVFPAYVEQWGRDDAKRKWVEAEQVFDEAGFKGFRMRGKIDGVFEAKDGTLWILETKTASQISEDSLSQALAFDSQSLWYVNAIELKLMRKVAGVLYNIVRVPQISRGKDQTSEKYIQDVRADIAKRPEFYFVRFQIPFPHPTRKRWWEETQAKLQEFNAWLAGDIPTYKNEFSCRAKWNCSYLPICACGGDPVRAGFKQTGELFSELKED